MSLQSCCPDIGGSWRSGCVGAIAFGVAAFLWPDLTLAILVMLFGTYILFDGIIGIVDSIQYRTTPAIGGSCCSREALRSEAPLPSSKLEALRTFTIQMVRQGGNVTEAQVKAFFAAGYVLYVILGLAQKTMSNYINHVAETPGDEVFQPLVWQRSGTHLKA